jgi:hypothetical protein
MFMTATKYCSAPAPLYFFLRGKVYVQTVTVKKSHLKLGFS